MASGVPILATDTGGTPEIIEQGRNGWIVPFGDDEALTAGLLALLGDVNLRARLAQEAHRDVIARFSLARMISTIQSLYQKLNVDQAAAQTETFNSLQVKLSAD